ncbi:MAG: Hsp20/alpha crystallin family protein [Halochromatium sp.]|uniref:Hsp20/alpha crystallin family protein n=1 Tax=Halochromatium sp. TaxID=2049430 RepID=UPI003978EFB7
MFGYPTSFDTLFDDFARINRELDDAFSTWGAPASIRAVARGSFPPINIGASDDEVHIYAFAPGLDPAALDISVQRNLLTMAGRRAIDRSEEAEYYLGERFAGEFRRVMTLPDDVDPDRVEATYRDGVLHVQVQRSEQGKPRQIPVQ